jgi:hypothetical protein
MNRIALFLMTGVILSGTSCLAVQAQDTSAAAQATDALDVQWLKAFEGKGTRALFRDKRFHPLIDRYFAGRNVAFWGNKPMSEVIFEFLGVPGTVTVEHDRFVIATGCVPHFCPDRSMLWVDTHVDAQQTEPVIVSILTDVHGPETTLWLYSNKDFYDDPVALPHNLRLNIARWIRVPRKPIVRVSHAIIVDPSGRQQKEVPREVMAIPLSRYSEPQP